MPTWLRITAIPTLTAFFNLIAPVNVAYAAIKTLRAEARRTAPPPCGC